MRPIFPLLALPLRLLIDCGCKAPCFQPQSTILEVDGYDVVRMTSSCPSASTEGQSNLHDVILPGLASSTTCHFDIELSNGQRLTLDVPIDHKAKPTGCCGRYDEVFVSGGATIVISAPADAGTDAPVE